jgi:phosphoribosylanthranilate isomerase
VLRVGVFVNESPVRVEEVARIVGLNVAQLHGDEQPADYPASLTVWKALRVAAGFDLASYPDTPAAALLLDGPAGAFYGGTGQTFQWKLALATTRRIILAGGLDSSNVALAVTLARPWGVDACSRIESAPGKKDHKKMNDFLHAAKVALGA